MADLVRASSLVHVPELIAAHGGDPQQFLAEAGIDPAVLGDFHRYIRYTALTTLVGNAAEELDVPDFGLQLSKLQDLEMLGPIAVLARNAATVQAALVGVAKYLHTYSPAIKADLHLRENMARIEFAITLARVPHRAQMIEVALGVIRGMFAMLSDSDFRPHRITFRHAQISPTAVYFDTFRCPVEFNAPANALFFPRPLLGQRIAGGDSQSYALAARYLTGRGHHRNVEEHVVELIDKLMPLGQASLDDVARTLTLHPRVLQRRLAETGTSFGQLLDDRRRESVTELLAVRDLPLSSVAHQLGYTEQSSLTRSCHRWFDATPLAVRRTLTQRRGSFEDGTFRGRPVAGI
ncbi:AraC family transcriptional regulator [[Mycobacterium] wendilense]|uniref:AraC family transcriptional regulator n=1 Tax=[Mycobacterium] wendilense TaxID=3064284 RepID=A0ABM9MFG6_9MYCO|nr:AraC family transcriptional regulator [Mycolicibacterium sp. MU0050]CAJ1583803.1 AraC family transcriptional regulator [Mycolicibacterium sp. MU0050]